jgi:hypothetical protein
VVLTVAVGIDGVVERVRRGLRQFFGNLCKASQGELLFIGSKLLEVVRKQEPLLIVFKLISNCSIFKPLLIDVLSAAVQA